mgnify:CR=1 FL=1
MFGLFLGLVEAFEAVEGVGAAEGVAEGDVALPLAGVSLAVLLGIVLAVELAEGDCLGVVIIPSVELADALFGICLFLKLFLYLSLRRTLSFLSLAFLVNMLCTSLAAEACGAFLRKEFLSTPFADFLDSAD